MDKSKMTTGSAYFIDPQYEQKVNDPKLQQNKGGKRPSIYVMQDKQNPNILWMCPATTDKNGSYIARASNPFYKDRIILGNLANKTNIAFLPQQLFAVTSDYVIGEYNNTGMIVSVDNSKMKEITTACKKMVGAKSSSKQAPQTDISKHKEILISEIQMDAIYSDYKSKLEHDSVNIIAQGSEYIAFDSAASEICTLIDIQKNTVSTGAHNSAEIVKIDPTLLNDTILALQQNNLKVCVTEKDGTQTIYQPAIVKTVGEFTPSQDQSLHDKREVRLPDAGDPEPTLTKDDAKKATLDGATGAAAHREATILEQKQDEAAVTKTDKVPQAEPPRQQKEKANVIQERKQEPQIRKITGNDIERMGREKAQREAAEKGHQTMQKKDRRTKNDDAR